MRCLFLVLLLLVPLTTQTEEKLDPQKYVTIIPGDLPIILSAPHGGRTPVPGVAERKGEGVNQFVTVRDEYTLEITLALAVAIEKAFGARPHVIVAHFERKYLDANRPAEGAYEAKEAKPFYDAYHSALETACKKVQKDWGRGLLLDIHGQAVDVEAIYRGTRDGKSVSLLVQRYGKEALLGEKSLLGVLEAKGYKVLPGCKAENQKETKFNGGHIVQTYGSHAGYAIDAIQFEVGTQLRAKKNQDKLVADVVVAIQTFAKVFLPGERVPQRANPE